MTRLKIFKINNLNTVVIKQLDGRGFFIATPDSIVMSIPSLTFILKFLLINKMISPKIIEGILEEANELRQ
jgi:hypothetical protein